MSYGLQCNEPCNIKLLHAVVYTDFGAQVNVYICFTRKTTIIQPLELNY